MSDIVERLRDHDARSYEEAADEIERLQAAIKTQGAEINRVCNVALEDKTEIERLEADKAAISQTASDYLHEIEQLRAKLRQPPAAPDPRYTDNFHPEGWDEVDGND